MLGDLPEMLGGNMILWRPQEHFYIRQTSLKDIMLRTQCEN